MHFEPHNFYHVYNRSFNRALLFYKPANYLYFLRKINRLTEFCDIMAYCLMPNHYHLLLYIGENAKGYARLSDDGGQSMQKLVRSIGTVQSSYTQAINKQENRCGSLFQPKCKAKEIEKEDQAFTCFQYIHRNPLKARLVAKMEDWKYSSFNEYYAGYEGICNKTLTRKLLDLPDDPELFHRQAYGGEGTAGGDPRAHPSDR